MAQRLGWLRRLIPRSRRARIWLVVVAIVLVSIWLVGRELNAPSEGHIVATTDHLTKAKQTKKAIPAASTVANDYFSLPLPAGYSPQTPIAPPSGLLYSQTITKPGAMGSLIINLSIRQLPAGGLSEVSDYKLRQQQTGRYSLSQQTVAGEIVHLANDHQSAAVVAFWPHAGYLATISISSGINNPSTDENADELAAMQPLLSAWQWR